MRWGDQVEMWKQSRTEIYGRSPAIDYHRALKTLKNVWRYEEVKEKFWYVYQPNDGVGPTFKHTTKISAEREAVRLARKYPGKEFLVLDAIAGFVTDENPVNRIQYDEVPF